MYQKLPEKQREPVVFPKRPEVLEWLERVEKWGLPNPGTFLDQPMEFMADIEAANMGRDLALRSLGETENLFMPDIDDFDAVFASAPPHEALTSR